jgi:hypothetical protein
MKRKTILIALAVVALLALMDLTGFLGANLSGLAHAQTGGGYDLTWSTIDGGGVMNATGGAYTLGGTLGQPDTGAAFASAGSSYTLVGGFWSGASVGYKVYLPLALK